MKKFSFFKTNQSSSDNAASETVNTSHLAADSYPIPKFWEPSYWEPTVQHPIRDYCRPGDVVFDIGANAGALSMLMSRLVGPRGTVCAFEASPRIIDKTVYNLINAGCFNTHVYYRAVYHASNEVVTIYPGTHLNDSIYNNFGTEGGASYQVETLAIDDFVESTGLLPKLIKMDIEGAELDALKGMSRLFSRVKPILILEQSPSDMRCHELLTGLGYIAVNLADYKRINSAADYSPGVDVANLLFVHSTQADKDPYVNQLAPIEVASFGPDAFYVQENGSIEITAPISLPPGRYACFADFSANGTENEIFAGIDTDRGVLLRYHTYTRFMASSYRDWVFSLRATSQVKPYLRFIRGSDSSFYWRGVRIVRFPSFDNVASPVIF